jgi:hypothetical protein
MSFYMQYPASSGGSGSNASVGANGAVAPTSSTEVGFIDGSGNLQGVSPTNPLPVSIQSEPGAPFHVIVDSSALPTGAATSANQTNGNQTTQINGGGNTAVVTASNALKVDGSAVTQPVSGSVSVSNFPATQPVSGTVTANQGTANATPWNENVAQFGGSAVSIGQQLSAASIPVVLPATQITALTPPTTVTVTQGTASNLNAAVVGIGTAGTPSGGILSIQGVAAGTAVPISGSITATNASIGTTGATAPTSATEIGGINPTGNLVGLTTDALSNLDVVTPDILVTGAAAQTATVNNILTAVSGAAATNLANYKSASVQVVSTGTGGTFIFEGSNDNASWIALPIYNQLLLTGTPITAAIGATASQIIYTFPVTTQFVRLRIATAITGGSIQAFSRFSQVAWTPAITQVAQTTAANLATTATIASGTVTTVTTVTNTNSIYTNADQASAAISTTTTGATKALAAGCVPSLNVAITAASGTSPTYDFSIQTSIDGANWTTVYQMPRQTTTGFFSTPALQTPGIDYRYVETIGGAGPSFTRTITSNRQNSTGIVLRNIIDRTINPVTTNSTTASLNVEGTSAYSMIVSQGTGGTSGVAFALDGSDDGTNWVQGLAVVIGNINVAPVTATYSGSMFRFIRARVLTGVASSTINYVTLVGGTASPVQGGRGSATAPIQNVYSSTNITTAAYTQLVASTLATTNIVDIFDSSGQAMILAVGPAGQEIIQAYIPPGGETQLPLSIPSGSRIAYKALTANATTGYLTMNFLT